jgi:tellurite resistance protein TerC
VVERALRWTYTTGRKLVVAVVGTSLILIGVAMIVLPGPAIIVVPLGLGVLGLEFTWARRFLRTLKERARATLERTRSMHTSSHGVEKGC